MRTAEGRKQERQKGNVQRSPANNHHSARTIQQQSVQRTHRVASAFRQLTVGRQFLNVGFGSPRHGSAVVSFGSVVFFTDAVTGGVFFRNTVWNRCGRARLMSLLRRKP